MKLSHRPAMLLLGSLLAWGASSPLWAADPAASSPHRDYDRKFRACAKAAKEQGLNEDARKAFMAKCMKKP